MLVIDLCGRLADAAGAQVTISDLHFPATIADVRAAIIRAVPPLADDLARASVRGCIDEVLVADTAMVATGSRVAFLPPVSGG